MVSQSLILQMANKKCVKSAAEKESDRLRSQRYRDEHYKVLGQAGYKESPMMSLYPIGGAVPLRFLV